MVKVATRVVLVPAVMGDRVAVKLAMTGGGGAGVPPQATRRSSPPSAARRPRPEASKPKRRERTRPIQPPGRQKTNGGC